MEDRLLFFVSVNQVLLRLWTRVIAIDPRMLSRMGEHVLGWLGSRCSIDCSDWVGCLRKCRLFGSDNEWSETR